MTTPQSPRRRRRQLPFTGEPNSHASRLYGSSTQLILHSIAAANTEALKACQHLHGGDPCSDLPPPPLTSQAPFSFLTPGAARSFLFGQVPKRKEWGAHLAAERLQTAAFFELCQHFNLPAETAGRSFLSYAFLSKTRAQIMYCRTCSLTVSGSAEMLTTKLIFSCAENLSSQARKVSSASTLLSLTSL